MNELPFQREPYGPVQLQQIQRDFEWLKDRIRALRLRSTPVLRATETTDGTYVEMLGPQSSARRASGTSQYLLKEFDAPDYFVCRSLVPHVTRDPDTYDPPSYPRKLTAVAFPIDDADEIARLAALDATRAAEPPRFDVGTTDIYIAKPYELRQSEFDDYQFTLDVESSSDGENVSVVQRTIQFFYLSATYRIQLNITDSNSSNWTQENQTIIPRFIEDDTRIYAAPCSGLEMLDPFDNPITLLAQSDGRIWAKSKT